MGGRHQRRPLGSDQWRLNGQLWTREGWLYLAVILDLHSRRVIGWAVSNRMKRDPLPGRRFVKQIGREGAIRALNMAIALRRPPKGIRRSPRTGGGLNASFHHTDRGSQYCSHDYQKLLRQHGFLVSMSGTGNCYEFKLVRVSGLTDPGDQSQVQNAAVETFFKTIKAELLWQRSWRTRRDAEIAIFNYINGFYNPRRRHSALGWKSPLVFEAKAA